MNDNENSFQSSKIFSIFDQGKRFTEELLRENERLRHMIGELSHEKEVIARRAEEAGVQHMQDKIRVLEEENARLRQEIDRQKALAAEIEEENREFANRYVEIERQNSNLINMYVASYQLHSTLDFQSVLIIARDIVINMLGAEVFAIYLVDEKAGQLMLAVQEEMPESCRANLYIDDEMKALLAGPAQTNPDANPTGSPLDGGPIAAIPLQLEDRPIGLILVYKLLIQKQSLKNVDFELIELLGKHAATAIYSAQLHARSERKRATLEGVVEIIRTSGIDHPRGA